MTVEICILLPLSLGSPRHLLFYFCYFAGDLQVQAFKIIKKFVVANQFLNWISRLKSDYDDVVKKNQELENRILQLVMLLPF